MKQWIKIGLVAAAIFQVLILAAMYAKAAMPLWTGHEIQVAVIPVDPRSLFRGNYAQMRYVVSRITLSDHPHLEGSRPNEKIYIQLTPGEQGLHEFGTISLQAPSNGLFIQGRLQASYGKHANIKMGIEAFFAPKEKALRLEKELRNGGIAVLMVDSNGKARLKDVIGETQDTNRPSE